MSANTTASPLVRQPCSERHLCQSEPRSTQTAQKQVHQTIPERLPRAYRVEGLSATLQLCRGLSEKADAEATPEPSYPLPNTPPSINLIPGQIHPFRTRLLNPTQRTGCDTPIGHDIRRAAAPVPVAISVSDIDF